MWVCGVELRSSDFVPGAFAHWTLSLAPHVSLCSPGYPWTCDPHASVLCYFLGRYEQTWVHSRSGIGLTDRSMDDPWNDCVTKNSPTPHEQWPLWSSVNKVFCVNCFSYCFDRHLTKPLKEGRVDLVHRLRLRSTVVGRRGDRSVRWLVTWSQQSRRREMGVGGAQLSFCFPCDLRPWPIPSVRAC